MSKKGTRVSAKSWHISPTLSAGYPVLLKFIDDAFCLDNELLPLADRLKTLTVDIVRKEKSLNIAQVDNFSGKKFCELQFRNLMTDMMVGLVGFREC